MGNDIVVFDLHGSMISEKKELNECSISWKRGTSLHSFSIVSMKSLIGLVFC